ncbi:MAG: glutamate mutase L [Anaerolineae bacterium]|jgi:hypothetical protein|nr:glutamate mutase L [Anaerolineae bacterium]
MSFEHVTSVLIADIGSVHTRLVLIDQVEGQYRLVASTRTRTTTAPPLANVNLCLERAAQQITDRIGRDLLSADADHLFIMPEQNGHGVDEFLATSSAGRPMRVFLVGLTPEISLASARRTLAGSYVEITDTLCPDDLRSQEEQINAILQGDPNLILIVGGTDDGAEETLLELVDTVKLALSLIMRGQIPAVLFAGNQALKARVKQALGPITEVFTSKNVRPSLHDEQLFPAQIELALTYDDYQGKQSSRFRDVGRQSQIGVVPTTQGYISTIRYLSEIGQQGIGPLCVDIGSANSVIGAGVRKEPHFAARTDVGIGHNMPGALNAITPNEVLRWLPFDISADDLWDYAYSKQLYPTTVPGTPEDLMIEQAFAREIVRLLVREARADWGLGQDELLPPFQPIIAAGAVLTEAQHPGISAMILLDALQPANIAELYLDPHNLISSLGVAAYVKPLITVQTLETGGLINLGMAFCPLGRARYGQDAIYAHIRQPDGSVINHTVRGGEIWMAPILPGTPVEIQVKLRRGLSINGKRRIRQRVTAGSAGIVFDARSRPLALPRLKDRAVRFLRWQLAMSGRKEEPVDLEATPPSAEDLMPDLVVQEDALHEDVLS